MLCAVVFVYKFIPETKGKTLEEIQQHFRKRAQILPQQDGELGSVDQQLNNISRKPSTFLGWQNSIFCNIAITLNFDHAGDSYVIIIQNN